MSKIVKIAIVGVGGMGTVHYSNYKHIENCKVVASVGTTEADRQRADEWGIPIFESIDEMLSNEEIDVIDVCTPTFLHKEHVLCGIRGGKNVICEKPIALSVDDAREMLHEAEEKGVHIYIGQVLRFFKEYQVLEELVKSGEYGKVLDAHFVRLSACPRWNQGGWMFDKEKSGQLPFDLHIHDLDYIVSLFGKPDSFEFTGCGNQNKAYKEHYRFLYKFGDINVCAEAAWYNADYPWTAGYRVYFENAVVESRDGKVTAYQFDREPKLFDTEEKIKIPTGINVPPTGVYLEELSHFIDCIEKGEDSDRITKEQIINVMEILTEITK